MSAMLVHGNFFALVHPFGGIPGSGAVLHSVLASPSAPFFLAIRVLHILMAALWIGSGVFITFFLFPTVRQLGPLGGQVMVKLSHRRFQLFMPVIATTTVLTGLWLYWQFTAGFDAGVTHSRPGLVFGLGGVAGLTALVIGATVIGRSAKRVVALYEMVSKLPQSTEREQHLKDASALQLRMAAGSRIVMVLIIAALVLMALGHYA